MTRRLGETVPRELQDEIIGNLWEDSRSLAICTLVSSPWLERARTLLFSNVKVRISSRNEEMFARTTRLMELLVAPHSRLGRYIQDFSIDGPDTLYDYIYIDWRAPRDAYDEFSSMLHVILPNLTRVRRLTIEMFTWARTPQHVRNLLGSLIHVVSVSWLAVHFNHLDELILFSNTSFPALETLRIHGLRVENPPRIEWSTLLPDTNRFGCLHALELYVEESTGPLLAALTTNVIPMQNIDTLDLEVFDKSFLEQVGLLIRATGSNLTVLKLDLYFSLQDKDRGLDQMILPISLSQNVNLKFLHFDVDLYEGCSWWLTQILESSAPIRSLKEIHFGFTSYHGDTEVQALERVLLAQMASDLSIFFKCFGTEGPALSKKFLHSMPELSKRTHLSVIYVEGRRTWLTGEIVPWI